MAQQPLGFLEFSRLVIGALNVAEIPYLIGGAVAVWAWGEARTTQDFDLVIHLPVERIVNLSQALEQRGMLVPPDILLDLLFYSEGDLPVNAIHQESGYQAELFLVREGDDFRATALARRRLIDFGPPLGLVYIHAPEDLILNKVAYYGMSQLTKHVRDIASILSTLQEEFDWAYFDSWNSRLNLETVWHEIKDEIDRLIQ